MSLATPERIRTLQRALYAKAKQEPTRRFHALYDKVWREDILTHAFAAGRMAERQVWTGKPLRALRSTAWSAGSANYERSFGPDAINRSRSDG